MSDLHTSAHAAASCDCEASTLHHCHLCPADTPCLPPLRQVHGFHATTRAERYLLGSKALCTSPLLTLAAAGPGCCWPWLLLALAAAGPYGCACPPLPWP